MKNLLFFILICAHTLILNAQEDKESQGILNKLKTTLNNSGISYYKINFSNTNKILGTHQNEKWELYSENEKFTLKMPSQELYCDAKNIYRYTKDDNEVEINTFDASATQITPSGILQNYSKDYKTQYAGIQNIAGVSYKVVKLYPKNPKNNNFTVIRLYVNQLCTEIKLIEVQNKDGSLLKYDIKIYKPNQKLSATFFTFNTKKYPHVYINDLR